MSDDKLQPVFSDKEARLLAREVLKAHVRKLRCQHHRGYRLQRILDSPAMTALMTAILTITLGGIVGQWITASYQARLREREFALTAYKDFLAQKLEVERRAQTLIRSSIFAGDDLIASTGANFNPTRNEADETDRKLLEEQRYAVQKNFNDNDRQWRIEAGVVGVMMKYYHEGNQDVPLAWEKMQKSIDNYMKCAERWYLVYIDDPGKTRDVASACQAEKEACAQDIISLTQSVEKSRSYAWNVNR